MLVKRTREELELRIARIFENQYHVAIFERHKEAILTLLDIDCGWKIDNEREYSMIGNLKRSVLETIILKGEPDCRPLDVLEITYADCIKRGLDRVFRDIETAHARDIRIAEDLTGGSIYVYYVGTTEENDGEYVYQIFTKYISEHATYLHFENGDKIIAKFKEGYVLERWDPVIDG